MQLKNQVSMDKRTDLASLFCMIGRHGPAVAVAVIAMVSVVAGFIIYRTVRGKRRKAAAGAGAVDGGGSSRRRDASLSEPKPSLEATRGRQKSTERNEDDQLDIEEVKVTRSPYNLRNRRIAANKASIGPKRELEPEKKVNTSPMLDFSSVAETCAEEACKDVCQQNLTEEITKDAEDPICLKHVATCDENKEKVSGSQEVEVTTKDIEDKCCKNNSVSQSEDDAQEHQSTPESIDMKSSLKELIKSLDDTPISSKDTEIKEIQPPDQTKCSDHGLNDHPAPKKEENVPQDEYTDDKPIASKHQIKHSKNANCSQTSEAVEDVNEDHVEKLGSVLVHSSVSGLTKKELKSESESSLAFDQKFDHEKGFELLKTVPCLNASVDSEITHEQVQSAAKTDLSATPLQTKKEVEDAVVSKLAEDAGLNGLKCNAEGLKSNNEMDLDVVVPAKREDHVSSSYRGLETAVHEPASSTAPLTSADMVYPDMSSFQRKESDQTDTSEDLSEVSPVAVPDMDEGIKAHSCHIQLLSCDHSELTWSSSAVGGESGISSMTVSPDLPDADTEDDCVVLSVADHYPDSEEHIEARGQFSDAPSINHNLVKMVTSSPSHLSPQASTEATGDANLIELGEVDVKLAVEREGDKTTEISIMEATMDNNEWITDGNVQVLPWMNPSIASVPHSEQADKVSSEPPSLVPLNAPCRNADSLPSIEVTQANTLLDRNDKKIVAVQPMPQNVNVTFRIHYLTHSPYQKVAITGNLQELGNWKEVILLEKAKDGHWSTVVSLPTESHVEWKFVVVDKGEVCRWEECGNRLLDTGSDDLLVHKWWGFM